MLSTDPNKGSGRLTKAEIAEIGPILESQGIDPKKEVGHIDVVAALLLKNAAKADESKPGQLLAAKRLIRDTREL
jgi:hypothetical protein